MSRQTAGPRRGAASGRRRPGVARIGRAALAAMVVSLAAALLVRPATARAQGQEGYLVDAPRPYRIGVTGSALLWEDAATRSPSDGSLWGLDVERTLFRYASVRLGGAFGTTTLENAEQSADANTYVLEVMAGPRLALPTLLEAGVVPFGTVGLASIVHDPTPEGLIARSQNAFAWGAGVEWRFLPRLGLRAEWRSYAADLENIFDPADRTGQGRDADRFQATLHWSF